MSGPKTNYYEIESLRRFALERERRRRIAIIKAATDRLQAAIKASNNERLKIERKVASLQRELGQDGVWTGKLLELKNAGDSCSLQLQNIVDVEVPTEPSQIDKLTQLIKSETKDAVANFDFFHGQLVSTLQAEAKQLQESKRQEAEHKALAAQFGTQEESYSLLSNTQFSQRPSRIEGDVEDSVSTESIEKIIQEIERLLMNEAMQEADRGALIRLGGRILEAEEQGQEQLEAAIKDYHYEIPGILRNSRIFEHTYQEYFAEYVDYLEVLNRDREEPIAIVPKERHRFATYNDLDREIKRLRALSKQANEHHYIRSQIDEVMQLFGYDMCKEIVFNESDLGKHYLCQSHTSQSAIHVYVSDQKSQASQRHIMLEIVSVGEMTVASDTAVNAAIVTSDQLTERERNAMLKEQGVFCALHPHIIEELSKRGVLLRKKSSRDPNVKYSKKILSSRVGKVVDRDRIINAQARRRDKAVQLRQMKLKP